jgi:hypothetical protein
MPGHRPAAHASNDARFTSKRKNMPGLPDRTGKAGARGTPPYDTADSDANRPLNAGETAEIPEPAHPAQAVPSHPGRHAPRRKKRKAAAAWVCHGLPKDRTCRPPANGVENCETDADRARHELFSGSGSTLWGWHLRRDAETGRMSMP